FIMMMRRSGDHTSSACRPSGLATRLERPESLGKHRVDRDADFGADRGLLLQILLDVDRAVFPGLEHAAGRLHLDERRLDDLEDCLVEGRVGAVLGNSRKMR